MMPLFHTVLGFFSAHRAPAVEGCNPPLARPQRDWKIMCATLTAVLLCLLALDVWMYFAVVSVGKDAASNAPESLQVDREKLRVLLSEYDALDAEHERLLGAPPAISDPAR